MLKENPTQNMRMSGEFFRPAALPTYSSGHHSPDHDDTESETEYWLVVKRMDGTTVASSDAAKNTYFLKRIKQYLDQLQ